MTFTLHMSGQELFIRPPGFYFEDQHWIVIFHARATATEVKLVFQTGREMDLKKSDEGHFWYLKLPPQQFPGGVPRAGERYKFRVISPESELLTQDPAARQVEHTGAAGWSIVTESSTYQWQHNHWQRPGWEYLMIYELHVRRFTSRNGTQNPFQEVTAELQPGGYLHNLEITALELLPVNAYFDKQGWGYNGAFLYAVEESYGSPDDLKALVDAAHGAGKAVILDVVYNHIGTQDNALHAIDFEAYFSGDTQWGSMFHYGSPIAKHFLTQNLLYLASEYRIDGFRFDMSHILHQGNHWVNHVKLPGLDSGWPWLRELRADIKRVDSRILLTAEEFPDNWYVTSENVGEYRGSHHAPFDSQWCDYFHDEMKKALTGGHLDHVKNALTYYGDTWEDATLFTESHDEVGNVDGRIAKVARDGKGWQMCQIAAALTLFARGIPMLFMGQEGGEWTQFGQNNTPPGGGRWSDHRLPLDAYERDPQRKVVNWYQRLLQIRRGNLWGFAAGDIHVAHVHNDNGVVAFTRAGGKYLIALNFSWKSYDDYDVQVHGFYKEIANSSWPTFNVGIPERTRGGDFHHGLGGLPLPAYGAVVLERY